MAQASAQPTPVLASALPDARPAGSTRLRVWGLDIYDASLWVAPGFRADAWAQGRTYPWPFSEQAVREASGDELVLRPQP